MNLFTIEESLTEAEVRERVSKMPEQYHVEVYEFNKTLDCLEVEMNGKNLGFAIMNEYQVVKCNELAEQIGLSLKITDITLDAVYGKLPKEIQEDSYLMTNIINRYILEHVERDMIFEKINKVGVENLTRIDRILLTGDMLVA